MDSATGMKMEDVFELADRVNRISVSQTMMVLQEAERYKARGIDVADFGPGEPDFPTPDHIKRAAIKALEENRTKYTATPGITPLRQAVCDWHAAQLGSSYQPAECIVTSGGKHAIYNAACALLNSGDEVIIPAPYWVSYPDIVKVADGTPVILPTRAEDGFRLRAADLEKAADAADENRNRQFAQQSHRSRDSAGRIRAHPRRLQAAWHVAAHGRMLLSFHVR